MSGEFTYYCARYYTLMERLKKENTYLKKFLDNAPIYKGETQLADIDYIMKYYRKAQNVKAVVDQTIKELHETEAQVLYIMRYFEIPPGTFLTGVIKNECEFEIWHAHDEVYAIKTKDLTLPRNPNYIYWELEQPATIFDDEDEWFPK